MGAAFVRYCVPLQSKYGTKQLTSSRLIQNLPLDRFPSESDAAAIRGSGLSYAPLLLDLPLRAMPFELIFLRDQIANRVSQIQVSHMYPLSSSRTRRYLHNSVHTLSVSR